MPPRMKTAIVSPHLPPSSRPNQSKYDSDSLAMAQTIQEFIIKCPNYISQIEKNVSTANALTKAMNDLGGKLRTQSLSLQDLGALNQVVAAIYSNSLAQANSGIKALIARSVDSEIKIGMQAFEFMIQKMSS